MTLLSVMGFLRLHRFAVPMLLMVVGCVSGQGQAQPQPVAAAKRHTDAQGIEMIQGRGASGSRVGSASSSVASGKHPAGVVDGEPAGSTTSSHVVNHATVVVPEQGARDRDRMAVLKQELAKELASLRSQTTVLDDPELRHKVGTNEVKRMEYMQALHQQNIKALTAEIRRAGS